MNPVPQIVHFFVWLINAVIRQESFGTIAWQIIARIPALVSAMLSFRGLTRSDQVDNLLESADDHLGSDPDAIDLLRTLPHEKEEELTDSVLKLTEILVKHSLKLDGYYHKPDA